MSSIIEKYSLEKEGLVVTLKNGKSFLYKDFPKEKLVDFDKAESKGKFYNDVVKQYPCVKL